MLREPAAAVRCRRSREHGAVARERRSTRSTRRRRRARAAPPRRGRRDRRRRSSDHAQHLALGDVRMRSAAGAPSLSVAPLELELHELIPPLGEDPGREEQAEHQLQHARPRQRAVQRRSVGSRAHRRRRAETASGIAGPACSSSQAVIEPKHPWQRRASGTPPPASPRRARACARGRGAPRACACPRGGRSPGRARC